MRAFVIRPFGVKNEVDFDRVERDLLSPALDALGVEGRTTIEILRQGNIRVDMFQRLLTADLVLADLSIHNANVFYELGIRHALREKRTFLLRCDADKYPFDLQTDRYFVYAKDDPAGSLAPLIAALRQTLASEEQDSPVFRSLPDLCEQDRSLFLVVPRGFRDEVERAAEKGWRGDLELLAHEVQGLGWESEGLRIVGRAQLDLKAWQGARDTWEALRAVSGDDLEANLRLGTIDERLGELVASDQALRRVLGNRRATPKDRSEALSLTARNAKTRWRAEWEPLPQERRREAALRSGFLEESLEAYAEAFREDLNNFYPGLNALAMFQVQVALAAALPEVWTDRFDAPEEGPAQISTRQRRATELAGAVRVSIEAEKARLKRERPAADVRERLLWASISEADLALLTASRPSRVADAYRKALADVPAFAEDAARKQIEIYRQLGAMEDNVTAALSAFPSAPPVPSPPAKERGRILLFTGHMVDKPGRAEPRFPPGEERERAAREAIARAVASERELAPIACGIAGGASGGDILFHEVCAEQGIPTRLYLALPKDDYIVESVQPAGPDWVERFNQIYRQHPETRVLGRSKELPEWLADRADRYTIWGRNNLWMLYNALAEREAEVTLIALWNRKAGDGPGGTADLVEQSQKRGAKVIILDTGELFGL